MLYYTMLWLLYYTHVTELHMYAHVCSRMLMYADECSCMLTYSDKCSHMLTYAHVCSRVVGVPLDDFAAIAAFLSFVY